MATNERPRRPLSEHAWSRLAELADGPVRSYLINPGVNNRFIGEGLAEQVLLPGAGADSFMRITEAGLIKLKQRELERS